jgi:hypothetical protein
MKKRKTNFLGILVAIIIVSIALFDYIKNLDSDNDGLKDLNEIFLHKTNPFKKDSDNDGIDDYEEIFVYKTNPLKKDPNLRYAIDLGMEKFEIIRVLDMIKVLDEDEEQDDNEKRFVEVLAENKELLNSNFYIYYLNEILKDKKVDYEEIKRFEIFSKNSKRIYEILKNKNFEILDYSLNLSLRFDSDKRILKNATTKAISYYSIAIVEEKLPENFEEISLLLKASEMENGDELIDFPTLVFKSVDGKDFVYKTDVARNTWMVAKFLKKNYEIGIDILKHPELFRAINIKITANSFSLFDAKYGISFYEKLKNRSIKVTDEDIWDLIVFQWKIDLNKTPQFGKSDIPYNRDFPWYNYSEYKKLYSDEIPLFYFFLFNPETVSISLLKKVTGIEAARESLINGEIIFERILKESSSKDFRIKIESGYYGWLIDRKGGSNEPRLVNTIYQFAKLEINESIGGIIVREGSWEGVKKRDGIDQFLLKNWKYWDLVHQVIGYLYGYPILDSRLKKWKKEVEVNIVQFFSLESLRAFGFPSQLVNIDPYPLGVSGHEWVISFPDYITKKLKDRFGESIVVGPGNLFGVYCSKEGLVKDKVKEINLILLGGDHTQGIVYLMKLI